MSCLRIALAAALSLGCTLAASPAAVAEPLPFVPGQVLPVRPGDVLTVSQPQGKLENGDVLTSKAFLAEGVLRMHTPRLTATVVIKCNATPGTYEVESLPPAWARTSNHGNLFTKVRVEKTDDVSVRACRTKLDSLVPDSKEEQWPKTTKWPQTAWDVRSFPAGSRIVATNIGHDFDGSVSLVSPAFANRPVLSGGKAEQTATATIACDAKAGLYTVYQHDKDSPQARQEVWARYRVVLADESTRRSCTAGKPALADANSSTTLVTWAAVGGVTLAAAAGALLIIRRRRSRA